jgi:hypothetical protein
MGKEDHVFFRILKTVVFVSFIFSLVIILLFVPVSDDLFAFVFLLFFIGFILEKYFLFFQIFLKIIKESEFSPRSPPLI